MGSIIASLSFLGLAKTLHNLFAYYFSHERRKSSHSRNIDMERLQENNIYFAIELHGQLRGIANMVEDCIEEWGDDTSKWQNINK